MQTDRNLIKAVTVAYSWLESIGINAEISTAGDCDLMADGIKVAIGAKWVPTADVTLDPDILNANSVQDVLAEIKKVTDILGVDPPALLRDRPKCRRASSKDYEATSMRLTPFSKAANPTQKTLDRYAPIIQHEARRAAWKYSTLCRLAQMNYDDLHTIGMVYLCVYLHRYRDLNNESHDGACLTKFLRQEYCRWAKVTCTLLKSVTFCSSGLPVSEVVGSPIPGVEFQDAGPGVEANYVWEPDVHPDDNKPTTSPTTSARIKNKKSAKDVLTKYLSKLPHDSMVETLQSVIMNDRHPVDARQEAQRRLKKHAQSCIVCCHQPQLVGFGSK